MSLRSIFVAAAFASLAVGAVQAATPPTTIQTVEVKEVYKGLESPWAMAFLPDGAGWLITEKAGNLRFLDAEGRLSEPIQGIPRVYARSQGGLLDVALAPDFSSSRKVYLTYAEEGEGGRSGTAAGYGVLSPDRRELADFKVIFRQSPKLSTGQHFGSRLVFDREGHLFIALGENNQRATSQDLDKHQGKIVRLTPSGAVPEDNPFVGRTDARPEIWSYGHRNQQGAALNPWTGQLWTHEHGPRGGDEVNIPMRGKNYGWPKATHGINYSGSAIPEAEGAEVSGMEPPLYVWKDSPAISGMAFYDAQRFPAWRRSLFIGALKDQELIRLTLDGDKVIGEERLLGDLRERIRDVRVGPDGYVYVLTEAATGRLLRVGLRK